VACVAGILLVSALASFQEALVFLVPGRPLLYLPLESFLAWRLLLPLLASCPPSPLPCCSQTALPPAGRPLTCLSSAWRLLCLPHLPALPSCSVSPCCTATGPACLLGSLHPSMYSSRLDCCGNSCSLLASPPLPWQPSAPLPCSSATSSFHPSGGCLSVPIQEDMLGILSSYPVPSSICA